MNCNQTDKLPLARTNTRDRHYPFGIKQSDRLLHVCVIGKTGVGKTTLLENMIVQDIAAGRGCALIDPHGDLVERVAESVPAWRRDDVIRQKSADSREICHSNLPRDTACFIH